MSEFLIAFSLWILVTAGGLKVLHSAWHQLRCERATFEAGHLVLMGEHRTGGFNLVEVTETPARVMARSTCRSGKNTEVGFEKLEHRP
jgi:hypothetical protein